MLHSGSVGAGVRPLLFPVAAWASSGGGGATSSSCGAPAHAIACIALSQAADEEEQQAAKVQGGGGEEEKESKQYDEAKETVNTALADFYTAQGAAAALAAASSSDDADLPAEAVTTIVTMEPISPNAPISPSASSIVRPTFAPARYGRAMVTGAASGELVHWERVEPDESHAYNEPTNSARPLWRPRALLFHSGAGSCTAVTSVIVGTARVFVAGSSEGFLSCWTEGGARCKRSALVLPFAPTVILPLYSFAGSRRAGPTPIAPILTPAYLSSFVPPRQSPQMSYIVCANLAGASSFVFVVRLPKFQVVCMFQHDAPLISVEMSHAPHADNSSSSNGAIGSAACGPFITTITEEGTVSFWKLSDFVGKGAKANTAAQAPPRSYTPGPSSSPPPAM